MGFDEPQRLYRVMADYQVRILRSDVTLPQVMIDAGVYNLDDLTDVNLDEPLDREALVYDEATQTWINGGPAKIDFPVTNNYLPGFTIGQVVGFNGEAQGDRPRIVPFSASSSTDPKTLVGVCVENMAYRANGHVRSYGTIYRVNTLAYPVGTLLYASTTAGELTSTPPTAPNHRIAIAVVTRQHVNTGRIFVRTYTPAYRLADLSNVASTTPNPGQGLVFNGSTWAPGSVGYVPGSPPPGGFLGNVFYQDNAGNLTFEDEFRYTASTNTLAVENITGTPVTGSGVVKGSNTFGQRYATQAATNRAAADTASITVERYFTVTAEGNGESFNIQSNTPSAGNKIVRKIWYKDEAFEATDVDTWTLLHTFADDTAYASTATKWQEYLDGQSNGTPPFTLAISWEDIPAFTGLLDTYGGAGAAYSLRLLDKDYTGSAVRVRRASDNTEQDIGFDVNGDLDTSALTTFCTGTNCFIRTLYDQVGINNAVQTTTANQPKIYDSSTGVITKGGKPAIEGDGTDGKHLTTSNIALTGDLAMIAVGSFDTSGNDSMLFGGTSAATKSYLWRQGATTIWVRNDSESGFGTFTVSLLTNNLFFVNRASTAVSLSLNGSNTNITEAATQGLGFTINRIGGGFLNTYSLDGTFQEMIFFDSDQSANRAGIQTNINDYYSIY
jgi:hypothetical protein